MSLSENLSIFGTVIYRAIGDPSYWQRNSIQPLLELLSQQYGMDDPESLAHINTGKDLLNQLNTKETLVSAVMSVLDDARYGLLIVDEQFNEIYHNHKLAPMLGHFKSDESSKQLNTELSDLIQAALDEQPEVQDSGIRRLPFQAQDLSNVYLRSVRQKNADQGRPVYLHYLMVADKQDRSRVSQEVAEAYELSEREVSIIETVIEPGFTANNNEQIAQALSITRNTLKTHLKSIYLKTGANSIMSLVSVFLQHEAQQISTYFGANKDRLSSKSGDSSVMISSRQFLCYREYGDSNGTPLIVLHNNYSSRFNIPPQGDDVAKRAGVRVIIPDRPGYGKSSMSSDYPEQWSEQLAMFADKLDLTEFQLVANSLSVRHALQFCLQYPDRVSHLKLTSPLLHTSDQDKDYFGESFKVATMMFERSENTATEIFKIWHASMASQLDHNIRKNLQTTISSKETWLVDDSNFIDTLKINFAESSAQDGIGSASDFRYCFKKSTLAMSELSVPTTVWIGTEDSFISVAGVERVFANAPNATIVVKEGFGEHIYYSLFEELIRR